MRIWSASPFHRRSKSPKDMFLESVRLEDVSVTYNRAIIRCLLVVLDLLAKKLLHPE